MPDAEDGDSLGKLRDVPMTGGGVLGTLLQRSPKAGCTKQERPHTRWDDCLVRVDGGVWSDAAQEEEVWSIMEELYVAAGTGESF